MRVVRIVLRAFAFVQWLGTIAVAVGFVVVQVQAFEELDEVPAAEGLGGLFGEIGPLAVSTTVTLPGLLLAIVLMLSAIYCDRAAGTHGRP